jgi:5-formyltetrahydrofolate cyclo-ligase
MQLKSQLRKEIRDKRKNILNKSLTDEQIIDLLLSSTYYKNAKTVLCYASLDDEISTDKIIAKSLSDGKNLALPYCKDNMGNMDFYLIKSFDDLQVGSFNVREPNIIKCDKLVDFTDSIIIVPAMCFDKKGYRLGYGKGYYDRFLQNYSFISIGLCYNTFVKSKIPIDEYDQSVDYIITQSKIIDCNSGEENG